MKAIVEHFGVHVSAAGPNDPHRVGHSRRCRVDTRKGWCGVTARILRQGGVGHIVAWSNSGGFARP